MAMTKPSAFTFLHANQVDALYTVYTATQIKTFFDSQAVALRTYLNDTLTNQIDIDLATKAELAAVVVGGLSQDSITNLYLGTDVKVGSLADLDTTAKASITDAINELAPLTSNNGIKFYGKYSQMSGGDRHYGTSESGVVNFSTEDNDDFSAINLATSTTKITIPSGVTKVKLYVRGISNCYGGQQSPTFELYLYKNGSLNETVTSSTVSYDTNLVAFYVNMRKSVSAGDYFEIYVQTTDGTFSNSALEAGTIFGMEVLG